VGVSSRTKLAHDSHRMLVPWDSPIR
jgi:hypothetical protein